jgi:phospholipid/cholesterol/gamma-HCH transport system substrate-binding protein
MARLGLFLIGSLGLFILGVFIIGDQQRLFTRSYRLRTRFPGVSGLLTGAEVRVGGVRKGTVAEIRLPATPTEQVLVTLSMDRSTAGLVKADSLAAIETEGLLGNKYLAVSFGSPGAAPVQDWDLIGSAPPLDLSDLFKKTQLIMDTTHHAIKNLDAVSAQLVTFTTRINHGEGTLGALVKDRRLYDQLSATAGQAKAGVAAFQENMQALKGNFLFRGYFKDRGYQDGADLTRWEVARMPTVPPIRSFTFPARELFAKADAKLTGPKALDPVGAYLEHNPFGLAVIQTFSGAKGDVDANLILTQAQALVLRSYLAGRFELDDAKVKTRAMGESQAEPGQGGWIVVSIYPQQTSPAKEP